MGRSAYQKFCRVVANSYPVSVHVDGIGRMNKEPTKLYIRDMINKYTEITLVKNHKLHGDVEMCYITAPDKQRLEYYITAITNNNKAYHRFLEEPVVRSEGNKKARRYHLVETSIINFMIRNRIRFKKDHKGQAYLLLEGL